MSTHGSADKPSTRQSKAPYYADLLDALDTLKTPDVRQLFAGDVGRSRKPAIDLLHGIIGRIEEATRAMRGAIDPISLPQNVFDPTLPEVAAWTVVLALSAQDRVPLAELIPEYGAGVYALYYRGDHPAYSAVTGTETPIYVGKADPSRKASPDVRTHGVKLSGRLIRHRQQIEMADKWAVENAVELREGGRHPLRVADFDCRKLVCAPGVQLTAESRLINLYRPLWNSQFGIAYGVSKHGDKQRKHPKSPWDVLHPGRKWATGLQDNGEPFPNQDTPKTVLKRIETYVPTMPIYRSQSDVFAAVLGAFAQTAATADPETAARLANEADAAGLTTRDDDG